jgi:hypothetical protein
MSPSTRTPQVQNNASLTIHHIPDDIFNGVYNGLLFKEIILLSCTNTVENERFYRLALNAKAVAGEEKKWVSVLSALFHKKTNKEWFKEVPSCRQQRFMPCGKNGVAHFKEQYRFENPYALQRIKDGEPTDSVLKNRQERIAKIYSDNPSKGAIDRIHQLFDCGEGIKEWLIEGLFDVSKAGDIFNVDSSRYGDSWRLKDANSKEFVETIVKYNLTKAQAAKIIISGFNPFLNETVAKAIADGKCSVDAALSLNHERIGILLYKRHRDDDIFLSRRLDRNYHPNFYRDYYLEQNVVRDAVYNGMVKVDHALAITNHDQFSVLTELMETSPYGRRVNIFKATVAAYELTKDEAGGMVLKGFNPFKYDCVQVALRKEIITKQDVLEMPVPANKREYLECFIKARTYSDLSKENIYQLGARAQDLIASKSFEKTISKYNLTKSQVGRLILNHFRSDQNHRGENPLSNSKVDKFLEHGMTIDQIIDDRDILKKPLPH